VKALLPELLAALGAEHQVVSQPPGLVEYGALCQLGDVDRAGAVVLRYGLAAQLGMELHAQVVDVTVEQAVERREVLPRCART
jgi:hypothetical protein